MSAAKKDDPRHAKMNIGKLDPYRIAFAAMEWPSSKPRTDDKLSICTLTIDGEPASVPAWKEKWKFDYAKE